MAYERREVNTDHVATVAGFVVVRLVASPAQRSVVATCTVDGEIVATCSAADNFVKDVISSTTQSMTIPVHANSTYRVQTSGPGAEVRWAVL